MAQTTQLQDSQLEGPAETNYARTADTSIWELSPTKLTLKVATGVTVPADAAQQITVLSTAGITLPLEGVNANQPTLEIAFIDAATPAAGFPVAADVRQAAQVAALALQETSLAYAAPAAGAEVVITAKFQSPVALAQNDHFQLTLATFGGASKPAADVAATWVAWAPVPTGGGSSFLHSSSSWVQEHKLLKLAVNGPVAAAELQTCGLQTDWEIQLPAGSLDVDDARLRIKFHKDSPSFDTAEAAVAQSPALGLYGASVALDTAVFDAATPIALAFKNTFGMGAGDSVSLVLPTLEGPDKGVGTVTPPCSQRRQAALTASTPTRRAGPRPRRR